MATQIKITQLTDIGSANLAVTTLLPVVNMAGVPTTQKTTLGNLANVILSQAGGNYAPVATANIAYSVANAAQPNITSVGTLTNVTVSGNATINGNITSNGTAYVGNLSTTGLASITTLSVGSSANLGAVANVRITGGTSGYVLQTDGTGNLSWAAGGGSSSYGNSNVATYLASYGSNTITTTGNVSVGNIIGNGQALTAIAGANVTGAVAFATTANSVAVANVSGLGNIATRNLDGNASNVLHGDGSWSADTTTYGNSNVVTLLSAYGSNTITTTGNVSVGNLSTSGIVKIGNATITEINPIVLGFTDDIYIDGDVLSQRLKSNTGTVALNASNSTADTEWAFNVGGTLNLPQPKGNISTSIQSIYGNSTSFVDFVSNNSANFTFGTTANNNIVLIAGLNQNDNRWVFGYNGNLTLPGNTFSVNYANGVQVSIGSGGNVSELVNGNNSFVLDSAGNVVFEGDGAGQAVDRGLVWDYGANANGVNSQIRQDLNGLTVRAWTENAGNYIAPVNIITGQDANTNTWKFDGQGNLTVPSGSINSISDAGDLRAYLTLNPDLGIAKLAGRGALANVGYTTADWTSATYTGTQIDFVDSPQLVNFFSTNRFNVGVNQTISINGDEPVPFTGYTIGVGNAVVVYTSVTASPDPTTVTSINFFSQSESYVNVDYDDGSLNINATGLTINIDNDQTEGPDIFIRSGDDITLQAKDTSIGSEREGGDINILAGDGSDDDGQGNTSSTGGDIQITAGNGGDGNTNTGSAGGFTQIYGGTGGAAGVSSTAGPGGYVSINGGDGGYDTGNTQLGAGGGYVSISAGLSTQEGVNGPNVTITSGQGGPNALAGSVVISTPASVDGPGGNWIFDGNGNLILANGNSVIQSIANSSLDPVNPNVSTMTFIPDSNYTSQILVLDPTAPGHIHLRAYASSNIDQPAGNIFLGGESTSFEVTSGSGNEARIHSGGNTWTFGNNGILTVPGEGIIQSINDTIILQSVDANSNVYSARLGTNGGLYFATTTYPQGWLNIENNSGNANITAGGGTAGGAGKHIYINAGSADQSDFYTTAGGNINITGGLGASNDGGGGGPGGAVNITSGNSSDPAGHSGNVNVTAGNNDWVFDYNGNLTIPGNLIAATASPAPILSGFGIVSAESFTSSVVAYANLPVATTAGRRAFISDANLIAVGNFGNVVGGGGSNTVCVWSDGTDWRIG